MMMDLFALFNVKDNLSFVNLKKLCVFLSVSNHNVGNLPVPLL